MNTTNLNHRLRSYSRSNMVASIENAVVTEEKTVVDDDYNPNPIIFDEIVGELNPVTPITNYDTTMALLSDSNEVMRRLDIIRMNVNYPVSGYTRVNGATLLKADPGLESLISTPTFTKRRLNHAIEAQQSALTRVVLTLIAGLLSGVIYTVGVLLFKRFKHKRNGIDDIKFKNIFKSTYSGLTLSWKAVAPYLQKYAPVKYRFASVTKKITIAEYTEAVFAESIWGNLNDYTKVMVSQPNFLSTTMSSIDKIGQGVVQYTRDLKALVDLINGSAKTGTLMEESTLLDDHKELVLVVDGFKVTNEVVSHAAKGPAKPLKECLKQIEEALDASTKVDYAKYVRANDEVKQLNGKISELNTLLNRIDLPDNILASVKRELEIVKKAVIDLATVYTIIGSIETGFDSLYTAIGNLNDQLSGAI